MRNSILCISLTIIALNFCAGEEKRAPTGFTGLRGKKNPPEYVLDELVKNFKNPSFVATSPKTSHTENSLLWSDVPYYKRIPSNGFFGLRGKKDVDLLLEETKKRVPTGFFGMRGKKFFNQEENNEDSYGKRVVPSGFWGMRGKRDYDDIIDDIKRAPESRFFGMRGKRQPSDFRGRFVGVRGKKSLENFVGDEYFEDDSRYDDLDLNQLMYILSQN